MIDERQLADRSAPRRSGCAARRRESPRDTRSASSRSLCGSAPCRCATSSLTESSTLRCWRSRASRTFGSVLLLSPNSRSNTTRGLFCVGSGVFAALPADRVRVGAGEAGVARARRLARLDRQLERRQLRLLARLLREDLIHRDAGVEPGFARRRRHVGEEARAGFRVRAAGPPRRRHAVEPAQHEQLLAKRRQRAQRRRELEAAPSVSGR